MSKREGVCMVYGYDLNIWRETRTLVEIRYPLQSHCSLLLTGKSGSGKSFYALYLLGMLMQEKEKPEVTICDFKASKEFLFLVSYKGYASGKDCFNKIKDFYERFRKAKEEHIECRRQILIIDEYAAMVTACKTIDRVEKTKTASELVMMIEELLMMGRGVGNGWSLWIIVQRSDSEFFGSSRLNFMICLTLGRIDPQTKGMLYSGENLPETIYGPGEGIIYADGAGIREVKGVYIEDMFDWKTHILNELKRE